MKKFNLNLEGMRGYRPLSETAFIEKRDHYRDRFGVGMLEAKRMVEREDLMAQIDAGRSIDDLKAVLRKLVRP